MKIKSKAGHMLGYAFLNVFANDDIIDTEEMEFMRPLALQDQILNDEF